MPIACWIPRATHTLRTCITYCFSTTTMAALMRLSATSHVHCLSWSTFNLLVHQVANKLLKAPTRRHDTAFQTFWHRSFTLYINGSNTKPGIYNERDNPDWCRTVPWRLCSRRVIQWLFHSLDNRLHGHSWPLATECLSYQHVMSRSHEE